MSENSERLTLDWTALVAEAIRRRKAEGLTQKALAALAGVSAPTLIDFERAETTLSLGKAFDILRVLGLLAEPSGTGARENFVREAYARWRTLTETLSERSAARFPDGSYRIDYSLSGDLKRFELHQFLDLLPKAVPHHTGWPPFWVPTRPQIAPREVDGVIECWLAPEETGIERMGEDPAHCDFWWAAPAGHMFLLRGYQEDGQETFPPGTLFDTMLAIWRLGETLIHAAKLARLMAKNLESVTLDFRAIYSGLKGRELRSWANPLGGLLTVEGQHARSDEAVLELSAPAATIEDTLDDHVLALAAPLYERFGVALSKAFVANELARMRKLNQK
jgi:transcriptional regulator with XRE-family HTH domain